MSLTVQAIQTRYDGHHFRSRLEARWAVFFNSLGIEYEYEKEGYDLDGTSYLPDFWIPRIDAWIEIKGAPPTAEEQRVAQLLGEKTEKDVYLFFGSIEHNARQESESAYRLGPNGWDNFHAWCECAKCGALGVQFSGAANRNCGCVEGFGGDSGHDIPWPEENGRRVSSRLSPRIRAAYASAQSARFEFGESPVRLA